MRPYYSFSMNNIDSVRLPLSHKWCMRMQRCGVLVLVTLRNGRRVAGGGGALRKRPPENAVDIFAASDPQNRCLLMECRACVPCHATNVKKALLSYKHMNNKRWKNGKDSGEDEWYKMEVKRCKLRPQWLQVDTLWQIRLNVSRKNSCRASAAVQPPPPQQIQVQNDNTRKNLQQTPTCDVTH